MLGALQSLFLWVKADWKAFSEACSLKRQEELEWLIAVLEI
jgi:hypothetical protein